MRYVEFRDRIRDALLEHPEGLTWTELKSSLTLPHRSPCPEWIARMEREISLRRATVAGRGRAYVWTVRVEG